MGGLSASSDNVTPRPGRRPVAATGQDDKGEDGL
jgi:hypothetical protein